MLLNISSKVRKVAIAAVGTATLTTVALTGAASANAKAAPNGVHFGHATHSLVRSNLSCATSGGTMDSGVGIDSQKFTDSGGAYSSLNSQGADDFTVTSKCTISTIEAVGVYYNGSGPATSENVYVYRNTNGAPGAVVAKFKKVHGADASGTFTITLPSALTLKPNKYWLSVQANLALTVGGQWGWELSSDQVGKPAVWENPADGFGTGCTTWTNVATCTGYGNDFMFSLS